MTEEYDPYPKICECCPSEFDGADDAARAAGWRLGWDGWLCGKCARPQATDEMIDAACAAVPDMFRVDAARAIEAGHNAIELTGSPLAASPATGGSDVE